MIQPANLHDTGKETETLIRLYHELGRAIYYFFVNRGCSQEEARDLRQETFLAAFSSFDRFRGDAQPQTWLFGIAKNLWLHWLRDGNRQKRKGNEIPLEGDPEDGGLAPLEATPSAGECPFEYAVRAEQLELVRRALHELPDVMRRCTVLRLDQEMPYRDIAELLQISESQVKTYLFRARAKLKNLLTLL